MKKFFDPLFGLDEATYTYHLPIDSVRANIESVFADAEKFFSSTDIYGEFIGSNKFSIQPQTSGFVRGANPRSTLIGMLSKVGEQKTTIRIVIKVAPGLKAWFWLTAGVGVVLFCQALITRSLITAAVGMLVSFVGLFFVVKVAQINNISVKERYRMFIDKRLQKAISGQR